MTAKGVSLLAAGHPGHITGSKPRRSPPAHNSLSHSTCIYLTLISHPSLSHRPGTFQFFAKVAPSRSSTLDTRAPASSCTADRLTTHPPTSINQSLLCYRYISFALLDCLHNHHLSLTPPTSTLLSSKSSPQQLPSFTPASRRTNTHLVLVDMQQ